MKNNNEIKKIMEDFIVEINNFQNFNVYDEVLKHRENDEKIPNFDCINNFIREIFDELIYPVETLKDLKHYLNNDEFEGNCLSDWISEKADGLVDIYYNDIYKSLPFFSEWVNEAKREFGHNEDISKEIQQGQYLCYKEIIYLIVEKLTIYVNGLDLNKDEK